MTATGQPPGGGFDFNQQTLARIGGGGLSNAGGNTIGQGTSFLGIPPLERQPIIPLQNLSILGKILNEPHPVFQGRQQRSGFFTNLKNALGITGGAMQSIAQSNPHDNSGLERIAPLPTPNMGGQNQIS